VDYIKVYFLLPSTLSEVRGRFALAHERLFDILPE